MSDDEYTYVFRVGDLDYPSIGDHGKVRYDLPDEEAVITFPAGTIVYGWFGGYGYMETTRELTLKIEARSATNYDNNRRVVDRDGIHLFWIRGRFLSDAYLKTLDDLIG